MLSLTLSFFSVLKDWIAPDPTDDTSALCKYCKVSLKAHKKDLVSHAGTKKHQNIVEKNRSAKECNKLSTTFKPVVTEKTKIAELKIAAFIAEHASIRTTDHLTELLPTLESNLNNISKIKMHRTKCSMLIKNVLGPCFLKELVGEVGDSAFSLIIDESTDVSTQKILCIMIRFFSIKTKVVVTTFYRIIKLTACDAQNLCNALKSQMQTDGLNIRNMVGIGVDGANVMIGRKNSVTSILKEELDDLIVIKCVCHSLHLCAENAAKSLPQELEFLVRETHNWFAYSPKRIEEYKVLYGAINNNAQFKKIQGLSGTRWLARFYAIETILNQWNELELLFSIAETHDKCYMASQLSGLMKQKPLKLYLVFLKNQLKNLTHLNMLFQSNDIEPHKLFEDLFLFFKNLLRVITVPDKMSILSDCDLTNFNFKFYLMDVNNIYFGYDFETESQRIDASILADVRKNCQQFLINLVEQIQKRLPDNIHILKSVANLDPIIATSQKRPHLGEILNKITRVHIFGTKQEIEDEWNNLQNKHWVNLNNSVLFFSEVFQDTDASGRKRFENIAKFALALLSLPISNAEVERAFSLYAVLKNKLRNKLSLHMLNAVMMIRYTLKRQGYCTKFEPSKDMLSTFNYKMYDFKNDINDMDVENDFDTLQEINLIDI